MDHKKINKIRKQRGYYWENDLVKKFNEKSGWSAFRLGGSTTNLPDISATHDLYHAICAIECKSGLNNDLYVPGDQIQRCINWVNTWGLYTTKEIILAFKFGQIPKDKETKSGGRAGKTLLKVFPHKNTVPEHIVCNYDEEIFCITNNGRQKIQLEDFNWN